MFKVLIKKTMKAKKKIPKKKKTDDKLKINGTFESVLKVAVSDNKPKKK